MRLYGVITAPDKPKGRGMSLAQSDVKKFALANNIKVFQPDRIRKNPKLLEEIKALNADIRCSCCIWKNFTKIIFRVVSKRLY